MNFSAFNPTMDDIIAHSFKDYHVRGFDYICLFRSPKLTVKLYFFDGDVSKMPEVVSPHSHRYDFETLCLAGSVFNYTYRRHPQGALRLNRFDYDTKLNGGDGFKWSAEERLTKPQEALYKASAAYWMSHDQIHTIRLGENETILCLEQREDKIPIGVPTATYCVGNEPPSLSGLYSKFTPDQIMYRLRQLRERAAIDIRLAGERRTVFKQLTVSGV